MISTSQSLQIMQSSLDNLFQAGMLDEKVTIDLETPLFGEGSTLDSMGFVTFVTEVEEQVIEVVNKDIFIVLSDIEELYPNEPSLNASMFSSYLQSITG